MNDDDMGDDDISAIFERAAARGRGLAAAYAGAVTPVEAHALIASGKAKLIDVRTRAEWDYVGRVPETTLIEWKRLGSPEPNPHFIAELGSAGDKQDNYLFLCRSGVRSQAAAAAAAAAGYRGAYNILEGFEGGLDQDGHRGSVDGWRKAGLPWVQS